MKNLESEINSAELTEIRPALHADLEFSMRENCDGFHFIVEDKATGHFFQLGHAEYVFVSEFDGRTTLREAMLQTARKLGSDALSESEVVALVKWMYDSGLIRTHQSSQADRVLSAKDKKVQGEASFLNPLMCKLPLFDPSGIFDKLNPLTRWLFSPFFLILFMVAFGCACRSILENWEAFISSGQRVFAQNNWVWLTLSWVVLKLFHELAHGITCRHYGGSVKNAGLMFILFAPIPFVDVTAAWRFAKRRQRIWTSAAGMIVEMFLASIAILIWSFSSDPAVKYHAFNIALLASVTSIFFNANFLMRFDGYYILTDLIDAPNLATNANQRLQYFGMKYLLGCDIGTPNVPLRLKLFTVLYGVASLVWRFVIQFAILFAAAQFLFGFGLIFVGIGIFIWIIVPFAKFIKFIFVGNETIRPKCHRALLSMVTATLAVWLILTYAHWPFDTEIPVLVEYRNTTTVRAEISGFVTGVHLEDDQNVEVGDKLFTLSNPELDIELQKLEIELSKSVLKARQFQLAKEIANYQNELTEQKSLQSEIADINNQKSKTIIRATTSGRIAQQDLLSWIGKHVKKGAAFCDVVDESQKDLILLVAQDNLEQFNNTAKPVRIRFENEHAMNTTKGKNLPNAFVENKYPELTRSRYSRMTLVRKSNKQSGKDTWQLSQPHIVNRIQLSDSQSVALVAGQSGYCSLTEQKPTLGTKLRYFMEKWLSVAIQ